MSSTAQGSRVVRVVGLTGGVAAGKSTVAGLLEKLGAPVLDADQVARELSAPGGLAFDAIVKRFGTAEREKLRAQVFSDAAARRDLEAILHPLIRQESARRLQSLAASAKAGVIFYEAALLVETGRHVDFDGLVVVTAPRDVRKARLMTRNGLSAEVADSILDAQAPEEEKLRAATQVIENAGDLGALRARVEAVLRALQAG